MYGKVVQVNHKESDSNAWDNDGMQEENRMRRCGSGAAQICQNTTAHEYLKQTTCQIIFDKF